MSGPSAILIAGPTASGKTDLAIRLACRKDRLSYVIINADSMQVYDKIRVITARPTLEQESIVQHRLFGIIEPWEPFSVGHWLKFASIELNRARREGLFPIFVGGTGLYFKALTQGFAEIPDIPEAIVHYWRARSDQLEASELYDILMRSDPKMAALLCAGDTQRIVRALSILEGTGHSLCYWWEKSSSILPSLSMDECIGLFLNPSTECLCELISTRFDLMIQEGALEEVQALRHLGLDMSLPIMRALGVANLIQYLEGKVALDVAVTRSKNATRRYAKRQRTWFRHQMPGWHHVVYEPGSFSLNENLEQIFRICEN
ncbi:MAG: tRNA (adenosine(37)-N6)-dimethylallyltransferase MiaA [Alphaproteobacteria bacterium]|nr:tRNA (adenosine(37)-N6)-dimethylallyltransferase MiaA [Alphaproteobacteria bacterium]